MDRSLEDLKRRFLQKAKAAKRLDSKLGHELWWCLLVTHDWFETQLHNRVFHMVRRWGGNWEDVKEMKQDVVLQLRFDMQTAPTLHLDLKRAPRTFAAWIKGIIHKISVDLAKGRFGRSVPVEKGSNPEWVAGPFSDFEEADIRFLLSQLPEPDRTAAMLRLEQKTHEQIGEIMRLSKDQVRTILERVRHRLKRLL